MLGVKRSRKLILTGCPFELRRGDMLAEIWITGWFWVNAEVADGGLDSACSVVLKGIRLRRKSTFVEIPL